MSNEREAVNIDEAVRFEVQRVKRAMELSEGDKEDLTTYAKEVVSLRYPFTAVFASRYDEELGECVPVEIEPPMLAKLRERVAVERKAEPVAWQWQSSGGEWIMCEDEDAALRKIWIGKHPVRPLYSTPPAAAVRAEPVATVEIRDLKGGGGMRGLGHIQPEHWWAKQPSGTYYIYPAPQTMGALSAAPEPVDSRDGLITDAMVRAYKATYLKHCDDALNGRIPRRAEDFTFEASRKGIAAALAAKEQQP